MEAAVSASAQFDSFPTSLSLHLWDSFLFQSGGAVERYFIQPPLMTFHRILKVKTQQVDDWYSLCPFIYDAGVDVLLNLTQFAINNSHEIFLSVYSSGLSDRSLKEDWVEIDNRGLRPIPPGLIPKLPPGVVPGVQDVPPEVLPELQRPSIPILPKPPAMVCRMLLRYLGYTVC